MHIKTATQPWPDFGQPDTTASSSAIHTVTYLIFLFKYTLQKCEFLLKGNNALLTVSGKLPHAVTRKCFNVQGKQCLQALGAEGTKFKACSPCAKGNYQVGERDV